MSSAEEGPVYGFAEFRLDARRRILARSDGKPIPLPPKVFDTLLHFVERPGQLLDKRALLEAIWPHVVVEENNLNQTISQLRRALGERPEEHRFIVTEPGRGYRFVASVTVEHAATESEVALGRAAVDGRAKAAAGGEVPAHRLYVLAALVACLALATLAWYSRPNGDPVLPNSIAVLPFENLSPRPDDAFFAAGLHGEILDQLTKLSALDVIGAPSMSTYANAGKSIQEIARELRVRTVLRASVRYADGRVKIAAQLMDGASGRSLWTEIYEKPFEDIFAIESEIAMEVATALRAEFSLAERETVDMPPTKSPAAYEAYLRARNVRGTSRAFVLEYLDEAIRLDADFALAYATKAQVYASAVVAQIGREAADPTEWLELERLTRAAADRALQLNPDLWLAHVALGNLHERRWRWTEALQEYERAAATTPRGERRDDLNPFLRDLDFAAATREQLEIVSLDPLAPEEHWVLGLWYAYPHDAVAAAAAFRQAVTLNPGNPVYHVWLAYAEGMLGNHEVAVRELRHAEQLPAAHDASISIANLAYAYARNGGGDDVLRLLELLAGKAPDRRHQAGNWALAYLAAGDKERARESLETVVTKIAAGEPDPGFLTLRLIRTNMASDPVLEEPAFQALRLQLRGR